MIEYSVRDKRTGFVQTLSTQDLRMAKVWAATGSSEIVERDVSEWRSFG